MNEDEVPVLFLREIDTEHLEDVEDNREAVQFSVTLTQPATEMWTHEFEAAYKQTPYALKPPVQVDGDRLKIIFLPRYQNELSGFIKFLDVIVRRANDELRQTMEMHTSSSQEQRKTEFREALKRVEVPQNRQTSPAKTSVAGPVM